MLCIIYYVIYYIIYNMLYIKYFILSSGPAGRPRHRAFRWVAGLLAQAFFLVWSSLVSGPPDRFGSLLAPRRSLGLTLGTLGRPWGAIWGLRRKSKKKKTQVCTFLGTPLGPFWEHFLFKNMFFHLKKCSWSVFFAGCCFH